MNESELLEYAAKAGQVGTLWWTKDGNKLFCRNGGEQKPWNPLENDGDALRLAVKLHFVVDTGEISTSVHANNGERDIGFEWHKKDPYAATRRAIVRAAAEIGRSM